VELFGVFVKKGTFLLIAISDVYMEATGFSETSVHQYCHFCVSWRQF